MDVATAPSLDRHQSAFPRLANELDGVHEVSLEEARSAPFSKRWQALAEHACEPNPFFEQWFLVPSLEAFGDRDQVQLLGCFEAGVLVGLVPVVRRSSYYGYPLPHIAVWLHSNAFCAAPLIASGFEETFWAALLAFVDSGPGAAMFLHCPMLPDGGPADLALSRVLQAEGRQGVEVQRQSRAMLQSDLAPADYYAATLSGKHRKDLRRQRRRLEERGDLQVERLAGSEGLGKWIADFLTLEAAGWKGDSGTALAKDHATHTFFEQVLDRAANAGRLERLALNLDGRRIAMLANLLAPPGAFSFKTAFDEDFAAYSPGMLLQIENLDTLSNPAIAWTDSCATPGHPMIERIWRERRTLVSRNIALGGLLRRTLVKPLMAYETRGRSA